MAVYLAGPESTPTPALVVSQYTLTMSKTGNGTIVPAAGEHTYIEGKKVMLIASPDEGCKFVKWKGSKVEDSDSSPTQITMNGNKTVKAVFEAQVVLTIVSSGGGTTNPAPAVITYPLNEKVTLKAAANDGFEFKGWSGDIIDTSDTYELIMDADKTVAATFAEKAETSSSSKKLYLATGKMKAFWMVDGLWRFFATSVHKYLDGLDSDDHMQYLNIERHDTPERHELGSVIDHDSHLELSDVGNKTHDQIDLHIDDKDNPHDVTSTQVGALAKLTGAELPPASAYYRGQFATIMGSPDVLYWCRSTDGGTTFEWKAVSLS